MIMKHIHFFIGLGLVFFCTFKHHLLFAQQVNDSTEVYQSMQEIIVTAKRPERFSPGSRITTIDTIALQWYKTGSLSDILQMSLPVYLKSYGPGMLSSIAFRGTSASHTAVLWNGFNIIQPSNGQTDFALIPVISSDRIDIQHGNASTNYGSGAIGGTILLSSPFQFAKGFSATLQQSAGSFGLFNTYLQTSYSTPKLSFQTKLFHQQLHNNFPFNNLTKFGTPTERQVNAALKQYGLTQDIGIWLTPKNLISIRAWYNYNHRQIPPAMGSTNRNARQTDNNIRLLTEWNTFSHIGNTTLKVAYFDEKLNYAEEQLNSQTNIQTLQSQAEHEYTYKNKLVSKAGAELQQFYAQADGYGEHKTETRGSAFLLTRLFLYPRLDLNLNLRQAIVDGYHPPVAPSAGYQYVVMNYGLHKLSLKGNVAKSYRVPTLNERFWQQGGNPQIKPEKSWSYENGLLYKWDAKPVQLHTELTYFYMKVDDWIQWRPTNQGFWSPMNVLQVNPRGIEFSSHVTYTGNQVSGSLGTSYSYNASTVSKSYNALMQEVNKQLMYVPFHNATVHSNIHYRQYTMGSNASYTGYRYTNNSNTDWLNSYLLLNIFAVRSFDWNKASLQISGRVNNLTNTSYQNMENRPMPGRSFELSLQVAFNKQP